MLEGRVRVNGTVVTTLGVRVDPDRDLVEVDGQEVRAGPERWIVFHKPAGALTTRADPHGGRTVYDLLPAELSALRYVGRLDRDTEGLLILSNEGELVHRLLHPSSGVEREYHVGVAGSLSADALRRLTLGVELEDGPAHALRARVLEGESGGDVLALVLARGRKREVRRLIGAIGQRVRWLRRVRFGPVRLGELPRGEWRDLTTVELKELRAAPGP